MKKFFMILGVIFAAIIGLFILFLVIARFANSKLDSESKSYVDRVVPIIFRTWDQKELLNNASPELIKLIQSEPDKITSLFNKLSDKLGNLKEYKGSKGFTSVRYTKEGKIVRAAYIVQVIFDKSDAQIKIGLIKHGENWQIIEFFVDSKALLL
jgi:hypothetical protein